MALSSQVDIVGNTFVDNNDGQQAWISPSNARLNDAVFSTCTLTDVDRFSNYLKATAYTFLVPNGSTINGIEMRMRRRATKLSANIQIFDDHINVVKGSSILGTNKANLTEWPASQSFVTYGGSADLWGLTWTAEDINSTGFGMAVSCYSLCSDVDQTAIPAVNCIFLTVYYTNNGMQQMQSITS